VEIALEGIVVIVGNYGSGKTEVAVNLAFHQRQTGKMVGIADLDLVNPYFRTREARRPLTAAGIEVVLPAEGYLNADLPILSPMVAGLIRNPRPLTLLDMGGDGAGATVLAALADAIGDKPIEMLQVVNPLRPATATIDGCLAMKRRIESASRLQVTGFIGNAHLMEETTPRIVLDGHDFCRRLADREKLPLKMITAADGLVDDRNRRGLSCPVLPIRRRLVPPWIPSKGIRI
jgi:hypothetical protein